MNNIKDIIIGKNSDPRQFTKKILRYTKCINS